MAEQSLQACLEHLISGNVFFLPNLHCQIPHVLAFLVTARVHRYVWCHHPRHFTCKSKASLWGCNAWEARYPPTSQCFSLVPREIHFSCMISAVISHCGCQNPIYFALFLYIPVKTVLDTIQSCAFLFWPAPYYHSLGPSFPLLIMRFDRYSWE